MGEVTVREVPELSVEDAVRGASASASSLGEKVASASTSTAGATESKATTTQPVGVQTPPSKIRHDWYQSADTVTLSLMVKGVPRDKATVDIQPGSVAISFPLPTGSDYDFSLDPLFARIDPDKSTYRILSTKIELSLKKAEPGQKWHGLEGTEAIPTDAGSGDTADDPVRQAVLQQQQQQSAPAKAAAPAYPTSSKSGPKNWDKLATDLTKKKKSKPKDCTAKANKDGSRGSNHDEDEGEGGEGEEDAYAGSDEEGDPVNGFFKKLYAGADPDTRRAMMKSYTESNGTALSTNWAEVKKGTVETSPPDGMEARQWGRE